MAKSSGANSFTVTVVVGVAICLMFMANTAFAAYGKAKCTNSGYPRCYGYEYNCPAYCPYNCQMDCKTCKTVCPCDKPGGVCQDPRFIGGDGIMFYFHGKRDQDFCLVSDSNLHINAHFIGKRGEGMGRDFTWVQSIGVLLEDGHKLYLGANKVITAWDDSVDQLSMALDGQPIALLPGEGASWVVNDSLKITRFDHTNAVIVQVENKFEITVRVVPISQEESRIHKYGISAEDCFAHLELSFKFYSLTANVSGVLGQTYGVEYKSPIKMGVAMPVMGGEANYVTSNLFAADCKVSRFLASSEDDDQYAAHTTAINCSSGRGGGLGIVCRR